MRVKKIRKTEEEYYLEKITTTYPLIRRKSCDKCDDYFIREKMWKWKQWIGIYWYNHYGCLECFSTKKDFVRFVLVRGWIKTLE